MLDAALSLLIIAGSVFALIGSWGLARLGDTLARMHAPTKATTLGVGCVLVASALWFTFRDGRPSVHEFLITVFLFVTAPVSAMLLAKVALHAGQGGRAGYDDPPR